jgi:nucleoside-diphosphate-sugar epimerase/glycine/D-amino acid oxidase-like deaminating enzyme
VIEATDVLVIGSGAGGAVIAATLAEAGRSVLVIEDGPALDASIEEVHGAEAIQRLFRHGALSPLIGRPSVALVEGRCVGGSTEVNTALWVRPPPTTFERWQRLYGVRDLDASEMTTLYTELENALEVARTGDGPLAPSSARLRDGFAATRNPYVEAARTQTGDLRRLQFVAKVRRSMSRTYIPRAVKSGARVVPECRAVRLRHRRGRVTQVDAVSRRRGEHVTIHAETVFVCGGPTQTPTLLRASGITRNVGDQLDVHPMVKVAAEFDEPMDGHRMAVPIYQSSDAAGIVLGGAAFSAGLLAALLSENWEANAGAMDAWRSMAMYYTACRSSGHGRVRRMPFTGDTFATYQASAEDAAALNTGLARLYDVLWAAGAKRIFAGVRGLPPLTSRAMTDGRAGRGGRRRFERPRARSREPLRVRRERDSRFARRESAGHGDGAGPAGGAAVSRAPVAMHLVTGATGWLGRRLMLRLPDARAFAGDLRDGPAIDAFCRNASSAVLFHCAGVIHPSRIRDFFDVNTDGTRRLLEAAERGGVRRAVVVSSNSPFGANPSPAERFDEASPYHPYMGYGRSKMLMEQAVAEIQARGTLETVIIRPPWFYGPGQPARQSQFFRMVRRGRFPIFGDGEQRRSLTNVENLCDALLLAARVPDAGGRAYWIADPRPYTMNEIVDTIRRLMRDELKLAVATRSVRLPSWMGDAAERCDGLLQGLGIYSEKVHVLGEMNKSIACSIDRARRELGYAPRHTLDEGMRASLRWCVDQGIAL